MASLFGRGAKAAADPLSAGEAAAAALGRSPRASIDELGPSCAPGSEPLTSERLAAQAAKLGVKGGGHGHPGKPLNARGSQYALRSSNPIRKARGHTALAVHPRAAADPGPARPAAAAAARRSTLARLLTPPPLRLWTCWARPQRWRVRRRS